MPDRTTTPIQITKVVASYPTSIGRALEHLDPNELQAHVGPLTYTLTMRDTQHHALPVPDEVSLGQVFVSFFSPLIPLSPKVDHAASIGLLPELHFYLPILHTHLHANVACPVSTMTTDMEWQKEVTEDSCGWSWLGARIQGTPMSAFSGRQPKLQLL